jgi:hypothetical protein
MQLFFMIVLHDFDPWNIPTSSNGIITDGKTMPTSFTFANSLHYRNNSAFNTTRIVNYGRDTGNANIILQCLTVSEVATTKASIGMKDCAKDLHYPEQLFVSVRPIGLGSHRLSSVGFLHLASNPHLCVARELSISTTASALFVKKCADMNSLSSYSYEFELIQSTP